MKQDNAFRSVREDRQWSDTEGGQNVPDQVFVDPGIPLQPLPQDAHYLRLVEQTHLQLKMQRYLPVVGVGPAL